MRCCRPSAPHHHHHYHHHHLHQGEGSDLLKKCCVVSPQQELLPTRSCARNCEPEWAEEIPGNSTSITLMLLHLFQTHGSWFMASCIFISIKKIQQKYTLIQWKWLVMSRWALHVEGFHSNLHFSTTVIFSVPTGRLLENLFKWPRLNRGFHPEFAHLDWKPSRRNKRHNYLTSS